MDKLNFASDYTLGAQKDVLKALIENNDTPCAGYGTDEVCEEARALIRKAATCPDAAIHFISGGTQANLTVIGALLRSYEAAVAVETGHIHGHEAGAVELTGHKVLTLPGERGKLRPETLEAFLNGFFADENRDHMALPRLLYLSQPTEYGTLYSLARLEAFREICDRFGLLLYVDGARLAYALASEENDVGLSDLSRLCDAYYIGGTKCGALFGEAVVLPRPEIAPHFFTIVKQRGALLAKGMVLGAQFRALFTDGLYGRIGVPAIGAAKKIKAALKEKGYPLFLETPTNQIFVLFTNERYAALREKVALGFWERPDESHTVARIATSWATTDEDVEKLVSVL